MKIIQTRYSLNLVISESLIFLWFNDFPREGSERSINGPAIYPYRERSPSLFQEASLFPFPAHGETVHLPAFFVNIFDMGLLRSIWKTLIIAGLLHLPVQVFYPRRHFLVEVECPILPENQYCKLWCNSTDLYLTFNSNWVQKWIDLEYNPILAFHRDVEFWCIQFFFNFRF